MKSWKAAPVFCLIAAAVPLFASPCTIGNGCLSDRLWIVDQNGVQVYGAPLQEFREIGNQIYGIRVPGLVNTAMYGKPYVLLEPSGSTTISDGVGIVFVGGEYYLGFKSDGDPGPPLTGGNSHPTYMREPNAPVDVTIFLSLTLQDEGWHAYFRSDVTEPPSVPEPMTIGLVGGGLLALAILRRRRSA